MFWICPCWSPQPPSLLAGHFLNVQARGYISESPFPTQGSRDGLSEVGSVVWRRQRSSPPTRSPFRSSLLVYDSILKGLLLQKGIFLGRAKFWEGRKMSTKGGCFECWADLRQAETVCAASVRVNMWWTHHSRETCCGRQPQAAWGTAADSSSCQTIQFTLIPLSFIFSPSPKKSGERDVEYNVKI